MKIEGRTYVVSGGSSGLGLATVVQLVKEGASVAVLDLSKPTNDLVNNTNIRYWRTDVTKVSEIEIAVEGAAAWAKEMDRPFAGAICCAGVGVAAKVIDTHDQPHSQDLWDFTLAVNLSGSFHLARLVLEHMIHVTPEGPDGERGTIIFASSAAAFEGQPGQTAYSATKGALASMTLPMARDLARHGVRVVSIAPTLFVSAMSERMPEKATKSLERELVFPKRFGRAEEFAQTVKWIIECPYVNGEVIRLTGGARLPGRL